MTNQTIVVMDTNAECPDWVDRDSEGESSVTVITRLESEETQAFATRVRLWLSSPDAALRDARAVVVTAAGVPAWVRPVLDDLVVGLAQAGGNAVTLVSGGGHSDRRELAAMLCGLSEDLEQRGYDLPVQFRCHLPAMQSTPPPVETLESVA
jgi:hypothetical protein